MRSISASFSTVKNGTKLAMDPVILPPPYELITTSKNRSNYKVCHQINYKSVHPEPSKPLIHAARREQETALSAYWLLFNHSYDFAIH